MTYLGRLSALGALALMGTGAWALPAAASTLGWQFSGTPTSTGNGAFTGTAFEYQVVTVSSNLTVTGLGEFDNGNSSSIGPNGDTVYVGSGTAPNNYNQFGNNALFDATITASDSSTVGSYWAFTTSLNLLNGATSFVLTPGTYWVGILISNPNIGVVSSSPVTTQSDVSLGTSGFCEINGPCDPGTRSGTFGANFEDNIAATPLPAALPLFAGGLGMLGFFGRRRKQKALNALAA
jgi:hypothetical protein